MLTTSCVVHNEMIWIVCGSQQALHTQKQSPCSGEFREIEIIGRRLAWTRSGITYEADPKHVRVMLEGWSMTSCTKVASPGVEDERSEEAEVPLAGPACPFVLAHRGSFELLGPGQSGLAFATKEVARTMSAPSKKDVVKPKRILRHVRGHPRGATTW